jgi:hypothetical protein
VWALVGRFKDENKTKLELLLAATRHNNPETVKSSTLKQEAELQAQVHNYINQRLKLFLDNMVNYFNYNSLQLNVQFILITIGGFIAILVADLINFFGYIRRSSTWVPPVMITKGEELQYSRYVEEHARSQLWKRRLLMTA